MLWEPGAQTDGMRLALKCWSSYAMQGSQFPKDMMTWNQTKKSQQYGYHQMTTKGSPLFQLALLVALGFAFGLSVDLAKHYPLLLSQGPSPSPRLAKAYTG